MLKCFFKKSVLIRLVNQGLNFLIIVGPNFPVGTIVCDSPKVIILFCKHVEV